MTKSNKGLIRLAAITILVLSLLGLKAQVNTDAYHALQAHNQEIGIQGAME